MIFVVLTVLGLCFGSFVNAFVWRLHEGKDWVNGRSECPHCHHVLAPKDLMPVVSWIMLRGKCRYCHKPIPDTPIAEVLMPILFVLSYVVWQGPIRGIVLIQFVIWLLFIIIFMALTLYDLRWYMLPDKVTFPLMLLSVLWAILSSLHSHTWHVVYGDVLALIIIPGFFFGIYKVSKGEWIGFGDVKLGISLALIAGGAIRACLLLFLASFIGVIISLPLVVMGKANRKSQLPFGPLLIAGAIIVGLYGSQIIHTYSQLFGIQY